MKAIYLIVFIITAFYFSFNLKSSLIDHKVMSSGEQVVAVISSKPRCSKSLSVMHVRLNSKEYLLHIGMKSCYEREYIVGNQVEVFYDETYDVVLMPYYNSIFNLLLSIVGLMIPIWCLYKFIKK